ncbi:uncharacterized protein LOC127772742 [Oryza glaberrima]|uniref:uncharacterized protein LOC127772742 n=1 Tax=Oryza glaberrima TaxID=4538 RepID=UPI00224C1F77|nr:uncharacterized protein LOC127772742 [Oryza glaberrima]
MDMLSEQHMVDCDHEDLIKRRQHHFYTWPIILPIDRTEAVSAAPLSPLAAFGNGAGRGYKVECQMRKPPEFTVTLAAVATLKLAAVLQLR